MKKITLMISLILAVSFLSQADEVRYSDAWAEQGFTVNQQRNSGVSVNFSITSFQMDEMIINGDKLTHLGLIGSFVPGDAGAPDLPGIGRYIAMPQGSEASLNVVSFRTERYTNIDISPAPELPLESENKPLEYIKDPSYYNQDAFYPAQPVMISEVTQLRGVQAVVLGVTPFQYNPVTKELIVYRDIEIEVEFTGGNGVMAEEKYRSRWWDPILSDILLNYETLPEFNPNRHVMASAGRGTGCEYLIISPNGDDFVEWANTIAEFRNEQGILTDVVTLDEIGGNTTFQIEQYVNDAYNTWDIPPAAILLLGDYGNNADNSVTSPIYNAYCVSDNIYADVDNNHLPEISFSRITARSAAELESMITKFINYENNPPTNPGFYEHPVTALGWQTERWFQICSETIGGFWKNAQGKDPVRANAIYQGTPGSIWSTAPNTGAVVNYFGPNGLGYIPAQPSTLGGWTGGTATTINAAINNGSFMVQHRDHGLETGWGEPYYSNSSINGLYNTDLTFIMSINCLTGKYNYGGECFTEKFHRYTKNGNNSGALGLIAASETSYSFVNDTYVWGVIDNFWPEFMPSESSNPEPRGVLPSFGNSAGKYFLYGSSWPYNTNSKQVTYHLFHHHGGAFSTVYSEVPQDIAITHDTLHAAGITYFLFTADAGALVAASKDGVLLGVTEATGGLDTIQTPPLADGDLFKITATKQNYYRYTKNVLVSDDILIATFSASTTSICSSETIDFTDESAGNVDSWEWIFEGGNPATSTDSHPSAIMYETPGIYDVTLIVSDGSSSDTLTREDFINVNDNYLVENAIEASQEEICQGTEVTFTANPTNGGETPSYQWTLNGTPVGHNMNTYASDDLENGDIIKCEVTSSLGCTENNPATSNEITMMVNDILPVSASIETETTDVCEGTEIIFTAISDNAGDEPQYQWRINDEFVGENAAQFATTDLVHGDEVMCIITSSGMCTTGNPATSNTLTMNVSEGVDVGVSIEPSANDICEGAEITFEASGSNAGETPLYIWKVNGEQVFEGGEQFTTADLKNEDIVSCELWSSENCAINPGVSSGFTMNVKPLPTDAEISSGPESVDIYAQSQSSFTSVDVTNADSYEWTIFPVTAGVISGTGTEGVVTWDDDFSGMAEITVAGVNECGNGPVSSVKNVTVFNSLNIGEISNEAAITILPNPNKGSFTLNVKGFENEKADIRIVDASGAILLTLENVVLDEDFTDKITFDAQVEGMYFIMIETADQRIVEKLIIRK